MSPPDPGFVPAGPRVRNTAPVFPGEHEDCIARICEVIKDGNGGEGENPSFVTFKAIDGYNDLPGTKADGYQITLTEGLEGNGPYPVGQICYLVFYRRKGSTKEDAWGVSITDRDVPRPELPPPQ